MRTRDQYIYFSLAAIGFVLTFALANTQHIELLFTIPIISAVAAVPYTSAEMTIGLMCLWLKTDYSDQIRRTLGRDVAHWDGAELSPVFFSPRVFGHRSTALIILFSTTNIGGLYLLCEHYLVEVTWAELQNPGLFDAPQYDDLLGFMAMYLALAIYAVFAVARVGRMRSELRHPKAHDAPDKRALAR